MDWEVFLSVYGGAVGGEDKLRDAGTVYALQVCSISRSIFLKAWPLTSCFQALLSEQQLETLRAYSRSLMDKKRAEMQDRYRRATEETTDGGQASCPQRDVTPVWRLCVADSLNPTGDGEPPPFTISPT